MVMRTYSNSCKYTFFKIVVCYMNIVDNMQNEMDFYKIDKILIHLYKYVY